MHYASELSGIKHTPPASEKQDMPNWTNSAARTKKHMALIMKFDCHAECLSPLIWLDVSAEHLPNISRQSLPNSMSRKSMEVVGQSMVHSWTYYGCHANLVCLRVCESLPVPFRRFTTQALPGSSVNSGAAPRPDAENWLLQNLDDASHAQNEALIQPASPCSCFVPAR